MTTFAGSDLWHGAITGPDPADDVTAASVVDGDTLLADRTVYLYTRLQESYRLLAHGETILDGTASIIDLKSQTTLIYCNLQSDALPALVATDLIRAECTFAAVHEGAQEMRFGIDHDATALTIPAEYRHAVNLPSAVLQVGIHREISIAGSVASGSRVRLVGRCAAAGNTVAAVYRAASLRWALYRKALP